MESLLAVWLVIYLCNSANDESSYRHLGLEVEVRRVVKLVKTCSDCAVVADLDEATSFTDSSHIAHCKVSSLKSDVGSILEDLVSKISLLLPALIKLLKLKAGSIRFDQLPAILIKD